MDSIETDGSNLIFLISQPRAGSTMLQRILGSHPEIHTASEPWIMLHPVYALRNSGYKAEYDEKLANIALTEFLDDLPDKKGEYFEGIRRMYGYLYHRALFRSKKRYFLDKTPRYYFIVPELYRIFPKSKFIFLIRNPLSVLSSIIHTWVKDDFSNLYDHKHDLIDAPLLILKGVEKMYNQNSCVTIRYEDFVKEPEKFTKEICENLKLGFNSEIISYGKNKIRRWRLGDQESVYENIGPTVESVDKWKNNLDNAQIWRLLNDYLQMLGEELITGLGYSYNELSGILEGKKPNIIALSFTKSLQSLLKKS